MTEATQANIREIENLSPDPWGDERWFGKHPALAFRVRGTVCIVKKTPEGLERCEFAIEHVVQKVADAAWEMLIRSPE